MSNNLATLLNTIWTNADQDYKNRVPQATDTNIQEVGNPIIEYSETRNHFTDALVNRIAFSVVSSRKARNPLANLKKGTVPLGQDIQDIFVNMQKAETFNPNSTDLLKTYKPDVKCAYYRMNRQDKYSVSISVDMLKTAFTSYDNLKRMIDGVIESIYSGEIQDEFLLMKSLVTSSVYRGVVHTEKITKPTTEATGKAFVKKLRTLAGLFKFPSKNYNMYKAYANANGLSDAKDVVTWTPQERLVLLCKTELLASVDVDVLAAAFNLGKAEFLGRVVEVDKFDDDDVIQAIICDESFFQVWDNFSSTEVFRNGDTLTTKYIYHKWQTLAVSPFANAVCLTSADIPPMSIDAADVTVVAGETVTLAPKFSPDVDALDRTITFESDDTSTATVSNKGVVTGVAAGTATITITSGATYGDGQTPASKEVTVTVTAAS